METLFILGSAIISIIFSFFLIANVKKYSQGNEKMIEISKAIKEGSESYLKRQALTITPIALIIALILYFILGKLIALGFIIGAVSSALAGYLGMMTAVDSNSRVAQEAQKGLKSAFNLAFKGGAVTGFLVGGLALLATSGFYFAFHNLEALIGLSFGGSLISVFARLGGGIFTKGADVGADLVGKVEAGIPEDDPRNPAVIADNVGDNVGDCAGMAADIFETYAVALTASMLLGSLLYPSAEKIIIFPLLIGALSILSSIIGVFFVRLSGNDPKSTYIMGGLYKGLLVSAIVSAILLYFATQRYFGENYLNIFLSGILGLVLVALIMMVTEYYTSKKFRPVKNIAESSVSGHATNIIMGLAMGFEATVLPVLIISLLILFISYFLGGIYGVAIALSEMISLSAIIVAIDSFGPITDNAGGISEMSGLNEKTRSVTDALDSVGNTTKAVTKSYAIASAHLGALMLFASYTDALKNAGQVVRFDLSDPYVVSGLFIGAMLPYLFASMSLRSVGKAAQSVVLEVRRQFKEIKGIMEYKAKPDYGRAVDIVTKAALKEMIIPALIPILGVIIAALIIPSQSAKVVGGVLLGAIISGVFIAFSMTSGGAAWDNAKKYIEEGNYGGKGSEAHKAAVTGDTVGDPYKDTVGPAINPVIKVINIVALLIVRFL